MERDQLRESASQAEAPLSVDMISGSRCIELPKSYDKFVYSSWKAAHDRLLTDLTSCNSTKLMRRYTNSLLTGFRQRRRLFDKYRAVDRTSFPWVSDALASSGRNRDLKKSPHGYKLGDLVEAAEIGIPGEVCSIREFYPGDRCVVKSSKGNKICHLRLIRKKSVPHPADPTILSINTEGRHYNEDGSSSSGSSSSGSSIGGSELQQEAVQESNSGKHTQLYAVDELVEVMRRAWIGINKPGGVGKIVRFHEETGLYDVSYVLGGRERNVEAKYISRAAFLDRAVKRDTLGRCRRPDCPCFIKDCGHAQPGEELDRIVEKINKAREKRRESKAPEAAGGSEGGASLKERGRSLSDDNDSAEALKDTSTNSGGRAVDPPRRRLRKIKPKSLAMRMIEKAERTNQALLDPSILQRMKRTYEQQGFLSALVSLSEGHGDSAVTSGAIKSAAFSGLREVQRAQSDSRGSSKLNKEGSIVGSIYHIDDDEDAAGAVRGRGYGVVDSLATVGGPSAPQRGSNNRVVSTGGRTRQEVVAAIDNSVRDIEEICRIELSNPTLAMKRNYGGAEHTKFIHSISVPELQDVLVYVNSHLYEKQKRDSTVLRDELKRIMQTLGERGKAQDEASVASSVCKLQDRIELLRLVIERGSLDVFDAAYRRQGKNKSMLTDVEKKDRKMLELSYRNLRESWRVDEQDLLLMLKQLKSKFASVFGAYVEDLRSPHAEGVYRLLETRSTVVGVLDEELGALVDDDGEAFTEMRVPSKRRRPDSFEDTSNKDPQRRRICDGSGSRGNAVDQYGKGKRLGDHKGGRDKMGKYGSKKRTDHEDFDFISNTFDVGAGNDDADGDFSMHQYLQYDSASDSDGGWDALGDRYTTEFNRQSGGGKRGRQEKRESKHSGKGTQASSDDSTAADASVMDRENLLDDLASAIRDASSSLPWADISLRLKQDCTLLFDSEKYLRDSNGVRITLDASTTRLSSWHSSYVLSIVTSGSLETSSAAELNLVAWKEIVDTLFMRILSSLDTDIITNEKFQSEFFPEVLALFSLILSKRRTSVKKDVLESFDSLVIYIVKSWHEFDCFAADRLENRFQLSIDDDDSYNSPTVCGVLMKIISMHMIKLKILMYMCEGANESVFGPVIAHVKASIFDIWNFLMWFVSHHIGLVEKCLKYMLDIIMNTIPIENVIGDSSENSSDPGVAVSLLWTETVAAMAKTGHSLASKTSVWTFPVKLCLTWIRKQRMDIDCSSPWFADPSSNDMSDAGFTTFPGVSIGIPWELVRHGAASGIKLKPQLSGTVQFSMALWSVIFVHSLAVRLAMLPGEHAKVPHCWSLTKFVYAALMAQKRPERRSLQASRFIHRTSCLASFWDGPAEGFDIIIDACADASVELKWDPSCPQDTSKTQNSFDEEVRVLELINALDLDACGPRSVNMLGAVIRAGLSLVGYKESLGHRVEPSDVIRAPSSLAQYVLNACSAVRSFVAGATTNATAIAAKRFRSKLLASEGLMSIANRHPGCDPIFSRVLNLLLVSQCSDIFEESLALDVDLNRQLLQSMSVHSIFDAAVSNLISRSSEADRKVWSSMIEHLLPAVGATALFGPWCTNMVNKSRVLESDTDCNPKGFDSWTLYVPWILSYSTAVLQRLKEESKSTSTLSHSAQYHSALLVSVMPSAASYFLMCPGTSEELSLMRNLITIVGVILSSSAAIGIDLLLFSVRMASKMVKNIFDATKLGRLSNSLRAVYADLSVLSAGLKGCIVCYLPQVQDTSSSLSIETSKPWAVCSTATSAVASLCLLAASMEISSVNPMVKAQCSNVFSKAASSRFANTDESFVKLSGCEDSVSNYWLRHLFWIEVLQEVVRCRTTAHAAMFLENIYAISSLYVSSILSTNCVPKIDFQLEVFRTHVIECTRVCSKFIGTKKLIVTEPLKKGIIIVSAILDYSVYAAAEPLNAAQRRTSSWSDGVARWSYLAACISSRVLELQRCNDINGLQVVRKETVSFVTAIEKCILYFRSKATNASSALRGELLGRTYSLVAVTSLCLAPALGPTAMASVFTTCYGPVISSLDRFIEAYRASRLRNKAFRAFDEAVPEVVQHAAAFLPAVIAYVSCTPFATRFLEWDSLLQMLLLCFDCEHSPLKESVRNGWTKGLLGSPMTLLHMITTDAAQTKILEKRLNSSDFEAFMISKTTAFRRFMFENNDIWIKFSAKLKNFDHQFLRHIKCSLISECYQFSLGLLINNKNSLNRSQSGSLVALQEDETANGGKESLPSLRAELAKESHFIATSAMINLLQTLRLCLGHDSRIVVSKYACNDSEVLAKLIAQSVDGCNLLQYLIRNFGGDPALSKWSQSAAKCVKTILSLLNIGDPQSGAECQSIVHSGYLYLSHIGTATRLTQSAQISSAFITPPPYLLDEVKRHLEPIMLHDCSRPHSFSIYSAIGATDVVTVKNNLQECLHLLESNGQ